jgi:tetraprenyl-beta-curcumene synthase
VWSAERNAANYKHIGILFREMAGKETGDPLPLSLLQLKALGFATGRELSWGLVEVRRGEVRWQRLAREIPSEPIRNDAMGALGRKRGNVAGAALFSTLPSNRSRELVRALVAFQALFDFLDDLNERHPVATNGHQLHQALVDAVTPGTPLGDYYAQHPWQDDAGYLAALVEDCRQRCESLPAFAQVQPLLVVEAIKAQNVLSMNHVPEPAERDRALQEWVSREFPAQQEWAWFELAAAASGQLVLFALFALAAERDVDERLVADTHAAYWPLLPLVATMLDSYVDQAEDAGSGDHQYVSHYVDSDHAVRRISELIDRAARGVRSLPNGHRHAVILSCMISFYLSKDSARTAELRSGSSDLVRAGGTLSRTLAPILRIWRAAYAQSSA